MSKRTVSLGHTVHILLTLECATLIVESVHNLSCELVGHLLATALAGELDHVLH